jgi:hypothetical protein
VRRKRVAEVSAPSACDTMRRPHCAFTQPPNYVNQRYTVESTQAAPSDSDSDYDHDAWDPHDRTGGGVPAASWNDRLGRIARLEQCMNDVRAELAGAMTPRAS